MKFLVVTLPAICSVALVAHAAAPTPLNLSVNGLERDALVFAPSNNAGEKVPVVLAFHGHGGSTNAFAQHARLQDAWPEALVVYPQGLPIPTDVDPQGLKPGWQRKPGEVGNRDLNFVDALLAKLRERYQIDDQHIFATGFSNGAFFTYLLWAERPQLFAAFAPVAGRGDLSGRLTVPKPAVQIGGRADQVVHLADVEKIMADVRKLDGCAEQGSPCGPGCIRYPSSKGAPVINWIHPGPHVYPPRATPLIISFFKEIAGSSSGHQPNESSSSPAAGVPAAETSVNPLPGPIQPGSSVQKIVVGGTQRIYRLHVPPGYDGVTAVPLVLALHGRGGNGLGMEQGTRMSAKADKEKFIVAYPNGLGRPPAWNAGLIPAITGNADDVGFIRALIDKLETTFKIDPRRVYSCGLSSGAIMSYRLGAELPDRFAAIGIAAGTVGVKQADGSIREMAHPASPVPVIAFHGRKDGTIYYNGGGVHGNFFSAAKSLDFWERADGCKQPPQRSTAQNGNLIIEDWNRCRGESEVVLYTFQNGTHEWPTPQNNDHFSATDAIWEFFVKHPKREEPSSKQLQQREIEAVGRAKVPLFLLQSKTDYSVGPSEVLGPLIREEGGANRATLYPPFGTTHAEGHAGFACWAEGIAIWGNDVLAFLDAAGMKPSKGR